MKLTKYLTKLSHVAIATTLTTLGFAQDSIFFDNLDFQNLGTPSQGITPISEDFRFSDDFFVFSGQNTFSGEGNLILFNAGKSVNFWTPNTGVQTLQFEDENFDGGFTSPSIVSSDGSAIAGRFSPNLRTRAVRVPTASISSDLVATDISDSDSPVVSGQDAAFIWSEERGVNFLRTNDITIDSFVGDDLFSFNQAGAFNDAEDQNQLLVSALSSDGRYAAVSRTERYFVDTINFTDFPEESSELDNDLSLTVTGIAGASRYDAETDTYELVALPTFVNSSESFSQFRFNSDFNTITSSTIATDISDDGSKLLGIAFSENDFNQGPSVDFNVLDKIDSKEFSLGAIDDVGFVTEIQTPTALTTSFIYDYDTDQGGFINARLSGATLEAFNIGEDYAAEIVNYNVLSGDGNTAIGSIFYTNTSNSDMGFVTFDEAKELEGNPVFVGNTRMFATRSDVSDVTNISDAEILWENGSAVSVNFDGSVIGGFRENFLSFPIATGDQLDVKEIDGFSSSIAVINIDGETQNFATFLADSGVEEAESTNFTNVIGINDDASTFAVIINNDELAIATEGLGAVEVNEQLITDIAASGSATERAGLAQKLTLEGAHHRTLMDAALNTTGVYTWATGDLASYEETNSEQATGEVGASNDFGIKNFRAGLAVGYTDLEQDLSFGGSAELSGPYILGELNYLLEQAPVTLSSLFYYGQFDSDLNRRYLNLGTIDSSNGNSDVDSFAIRLRADWNAYQTEHFRLTPRVSYTWSRNEADGFTETGGGLPVSYDDYSDDQHEVRVGVDFDTIWTEKFSTRLIGEYIYTWDEESSFGVSSNGLSLTGQDIAGQDLSGGAVRGGIESTYLLTPNQNIRLAVFGSTSDSSPTASVALSYGFQF